VEVLDLMMAGICLMNMLRMSDGMCIGMLASGIGAVHLACRLVRSRSSFDAGDAVGRVIINLPGYCERMAGRTWVSLMISLSSNSRVGVVFVSAVIFIASSPVEEVGYQAVSINLSWSFRMDRGRCGSRSRSRCCWGSILWCIRREV